MTYPNEILFGAVSLLETVCPEKILIVGESLFKTANSYQEHCNLIQKNCSITHIDITTKLNDTAYLQRYDLVIIGEVIENKRKQSAEHIIGRLRDLCSPKIILLTNLSDSDWAENELFGFGFNKYANYTVEDSDYVLYQYNIDSYKKTPDWFNPKNWANPQLWNKFWW